jgi:hypothetical protein
MLRGKLETKLNLLIGEKLQDSAFLERILQDYHEALARSSSLETRGVDHATVVQKLETLRDKESRILEAFFEGVIDRTRRDAALRTVEREICSYKELLSLSTKQPQSQSVPDLEALLRVIEPLADWEFLSRDHRRALLQQFCPEISVYRYDVRSLFLNLGAATATLRDGDKGTHSRKAA